MELQLVDDEGDETGATVRLDEKRKLWRGDGQTFAEGGDPLYKLPAGFYKPGMTRSGLILTAHKTYMDGLLALPDTPSEAVLAEIRQFWKLKHEFVKRGLVFKRGVLLHGAPGVGKSATIAALVNALVAKHDGVALAIFDPNEATAALRMIRSIEPNRPIVVTVEDIDRFIDSPYEAGYLSLLDGDAQIDNVVYVATTNHLDRLPPRLVNRPSRFDLVMEIGWPSPVARRGYLKAKEPSLTAADLEEWVDMTGGFSIAHLRELIVLVMAFGYPLGAAVARLQKMIEGAKP